MELSARLSERRASHRRAALAVTLGATALGVLAPTPSLEVRAVVAAVVVVALGLPHGALDALVHARRASRVGGVGFLLAYLAAAAAMVGLWALSPPLALGAFLAMSAVHFGRGDLAAGPGVPGNRLEVAVRGTLPLVLPVAFHPAEASALFGLLLDLPAERVGALLAPAALPLLGVWAAATGLWLVRSRYRGSPDGSRLELLVLGAAFAALPPLLAFALYFGLWHSLRHLIALDTLLGVRARLDRRRLVRHGLPVLAATIALLAGAYAVEAGPAVDQEALLRVLFVALAALTVPHLAVTALVERDLRVDSSKPSAR